jgi:hypothetical protein
MFGLQPLKILTLTVPAMVIPLALSSNSNIYIFN